MISFLSLSDGDYSQAITYYTQAIELNPFVAAYYGNRSFAHLRTESFGYALSDASKALQLDRNYIKVTVSNSQKLGQGNTLKYTKAMSR